METFKQLNVLQILSKPVGKGLLTALLMIGMGLWIKESDSQNEAWSRYVMYVIYAAGISWTLWTAKKNPSNAGSFGSLFQEGFRLFVVSALIMVAFTLYLLWSHPEYAQEEAKHQRTLLIETKKYTPDQVEELVKEAEKQYPVRYISATVFGYLFMGAVFAAAGSIVLARKN